MACEARIRMFPEDTPEDVLRLIRRYHSSLYDAEKWFLREVSEMLKLHPLWRWCEAVKGLGPVAALTFLSFIDPEKADTAGKVKAYAGMVPGKARRSGQRVNVNFEFKGRVWLITRNVIMHRDPYYYPLYMQKKQYYLENSRRVWDEKRQEWVEWPPFKVILENPLACPKYEECVKRLRGRAERLGRPPKKPPCKLHLDSTAKRWLAGLLLSHAAQLIREAEGLPIDNFLKHKDYIPPKPH